MKNTVRPINSSSSWLFLIGLIFPAITVYGNMMLIFNSFSLSSVILIASGLLMTYCISMDALKIVFKSKFVFYDDYVEITRFDRLTDYYSFNIRNIFKAIPATVIKIKYSDIEQFGLFDGSQLYKRGLDENNRMLVTAVWEKKAYDFVVPEQFSAIRKYLLINDAEKNSCMIDVKHYSASQVSVILRSFEQYTGRKTCGGYPSNWKAAFKITVWGVLTALTARFGLPLLDAFLNPMHPINERETIKGIYVLCGILFAVVSSLGFVIRNNKPEDEKKAQKARITGRIVLYISLGFFAATVILFFKSISI